MDYRAQLVALAETYAAAIGRSEATVANAMGRDGRFFIRLRQGRGCSVDTLNHVLRWFADHWPEGVPWPDAVERPASSESAESPGAAA